MRAQLGPQAFAGFDPVPAAGDDRAAFLDAKRGHHRIGGVVAPGKADAGRLLCRVDQHIEEIRGARCLRPQSSIGEEARQRAFRLRIGHPVDRIRVVAGESS